LGSWLGLERAVPSAQQYEKLLRCLIRHNDIHPPVFVEITDRNSTVTAKREARGGIHPREGAIPVAEQHGNCAGANIGCDQVGLPVTVEISSRHCCGRRTYRNWDLALKAAITVAE